MLLCIMIFFRTLLNVDTQLEDFLFISLGKFQQDNKWLVDIILRSIEQSEKMKSQLSVNIGIRCMNILYLVLGKEKKLEKNQF